MSERDPHRLPTTVVPSHYDLLLAPDLDAATFDGTAVIALEALEAVDEIVLHALDLEVSESWLQRDDQRLETTWTFDAEAETATLALSSTAGAGDWELHVTYTGELNDKLVGFYRSSFADDDGRTRHLATTQFESTHARRAFPCWDEPAYKASFSVTMDVADGLTAISNAAEIGYEPLSGNRRRVRFAPTMVMSTYLVAFIVGPLEISAPVDVDGTALRVIAPPGKAELTSFALEVGEFSLRFLAGWYAIPYPGDKLDLIAIPDFSFGAMENLGAVTFRETALLLDRDRATQPEQQRVADVIAHEIAHMWFGDLVTMGWWNGIWLNEAFATFMEMLTTDAYCPEWERWTDFGLARSAAFDTDSLSSTRPIEFEVITAADSEAMFDVLTYEKGASVVRMLQQYLGEDRFQTGIRRYLATHAYANTETGDLWDAIEEATGEPVRAIMDSWIFRPGHPAISFVRSEDATSIEISQSRFSFEADPAADIERPDDAPRSVPVVVRIGHAEGTSVHKVLLDETSHTLALEHTADWIVGNHESNGFYRVELGDAELAAVAAQASADLSPSERYALVEDEWALLLAGRGSVQRLLSVLRSLADEDDLSVWQRMIGVLGGLDRVADPADREGLAAWTRALVGPALLRLGATRSPGEPERTSALRATLFEALARIGQDTECRATADAHFSALADDPDAVDPDLADAVVRVVAAHASDSQWEDLRRRSAAAQTPQDRLRHQGALADAEDPALVRRFCDIVFTDEVRTQDGLFLLRRALTNREATSQVWELIEERWDAIDERFPSASVPRMLEGIRSITGRDLATRVADFLAAHPSPHGATVIRQHLERMWVTVGLTARVRAELGAAVS